MNRKERRAAAKLGRPASPQSASLLETAFRHHQAGALAEAERIYRDLIALEERNAAAMHLFGVLLHQSGRHDEAVTLLQKAIAIDPRAPDFHYNLGAALHALQRLPDAAVAYARAVALKPDHADAHFEIGNMLARQGRFAEAAESFGRAVAIKPTPAALNNLGMALREIGRLDEAIAQWQRAIKLKRDFHLACVNLGLAHRLRGELAEAEVNFRQAANNKPDDIEIAVNLAGVLVAAGKPEDAVAMRVPVARAMSEPWLRPLSFEPVPAAILHADPSIRAGIAAAQAHWPHLAPIEALAAAGKQVLAANPLLIATLQYAPLADVALERFATALRAAMLAIAQRTPAEAAWNTAELALLCAIARQCFINEYAFAISDAERTAAHELRGRLAAALVDGSAVAPAWIAAVACYIPLHDIARAEVLPERNWPEPLGPLLTQQIIEPRQEQELRKTIPALTAIEPGVSSRVQEQYERNPYPRWIRTAPQPTQIPIGAFLKREFPHANFATPITTGIDILIAGCGTGLHPTVSARRYPGARVLAVDISRTSLAYASRKTRELGIGNIRFAQADILRLAEIGETFDLIESVGVLHHLSDPWAGWRILIDLLRPRGFMLIGLYSEIARRHIVAAQQFVKNGNFPPDPDGIRASRQAIMSQAEESPLRAVTKMSDFYSISGCRDLIFHVQERRTDFLQIETFLSANGLDLVGIDVDGGLRAAYAHRFPHDTAMIDLACWHQFETENPDSFLNMYNIWVQKR